MKQKKLFAVLLLIIAAALVISGCDFGKNNSPSVSGGSAEFSQSKKENVTTEPPTTEFPYSAQDKLVALTFDDGPRVSTTGHILDLLEQYGGHATFFVIGENIEGKQAVMKRAVSLGCAVGNHSMNHKTLTKLGDEAMRSQIDECSVAIKNATGVAPTLMRAPGGAFKGIESRVGFPLIQWSIDTNDWRYKDSAKSGRSAAQRDADLQKVAASVLDHVQPGDIVLMHDIYDFSADVCDIVIPELVSRGYKLVTVEEMYKAYDKELTAGKVYRSVKLETAQTSASQ